ncbi:unnamed protein product [Pylaiella littoralis]
MSAPEVPRDGTTLVSFSAEDVPVKAVTVYRKNKAEVTRVVDFSSPSSLGRHEVELTDLPGHALIDGTSVRVKGSGHCTILHVSYSDKPKDIIRTELTQEEKDEAKAKEEKLKQDIQRLSDEITTLKQESSRNKHMRTFADRFAERTVVATAGGSANAAAALGVSENGPPPSVDDVSKVLDWWAAKAAQTDAEVHRLELVERRVIDAIAELRRAQAAPARTASARETVWDAAKKPPGRVSVTVDVQELGPIDLEVKYMTRGATWSPSYDLRVDTQTDSISCTYYGMVTQSTTEDWEGVALRLSTAEPTVHGTPPALGIKVVSLRTIPIAVTVSGRPNGRRQAMAARTRSLRLGHAEMDEEESACDDVETPALMMSSAGGGGYGGGSGRGSGGFPRARAACAPPPPPQAKRAVAQVEGGGGGMGAVSFVVEKPADIKSNGQTKKLTVGILELSAEVTHYVVPAKEAAAYLQAKATNNTDYLLLASDDVSIFFDNSFVTKTSINSVSPGESFQTFLGIDPAVKITVAPPRKSSKRRGIFSKSNHVTHTHSTSVSNKKKVPVTCVIVDAMPRSTDEIIKVNLKQPLPASVSEAEAITDDVLVSTALEIFCGDGDGESCNVAQLAHMTPAGTRLAGVIKSSSNHLAWVGKIAPQDEISIPLEYTVEWPTGKEIEMRG